MSSGQWEQGNTELSDDQLLAAGELQACLRTDGDGGGAWSLADRWSGVVSGIQGEVMDSDGCAAMWVPLTQLV